VGFGDIARPDKANAPHFHWLKSVIGPGIAS
jgi:hypothetical protein